MIAKLAHLCDEDNFRGEGVIAMIMVVNSQ